MTKEEKILEPKDDLELVKEMLAHGEFDDIREMARMWRGAKSLGYLGSTVIKLLTMVAALYGAYYAFSMWAAQFIKVSQ